MADVIDFPSGSCKQDVTDLICLSAHLNLNRKLEVAEKERLSKAKSEGMRGFHTNILGEMNCACVRGVLLESLKITLLRKLQTFFLQFYGHGLIGKNKNI